MRSRRPSSRATGPSWYAALNSRAKIAQAMDETRQKLREAKTADEQHDAALTLEALRDERRRHEQIIQKGVKTRRENKRAARFKRMGGQGEFSPLRLGSLFDSFVKNADEDDRLQERGRLRRGEHPPEEALVQAAPQSNECFATQYRRSTSMLPLKKPIGTRTRRTRRKRAKFVTPDLVLVAGKLLRFVASPDNPLSRAEHLRAEYAEMENGHPAKVMQFLQFLQRVYFVADQFRRRPGDFERLQAHPFWKQWRQQPRDRSTSKWVLYFIMQATTTNDRNRARKYAAILDALMQDQVEVGAVASRIKELGGIDAAYEAMQARTCG
jgi:hypothetical protein